NKKQLNSSEYQDGETQWQREAEAKTRQGLRAVAGRRWHSLNHNPEKRSSGGHARPLFCLFFSGAESGRTRERFLGPSEDTRRCRPDPERDAGDGIVASRLRRTALPGGSVDVLTSRPTCRHLDASVPLCPPCQNSGLTAGIRCP